MHNIRMYTYAWVYVYINTDTHNSAGKMLKLSVQVTQKGKTGG